MREMDTTSSLPPLDDEEEAECPEMNASYDPFLENAISSFFMTPFTPISNHEEWLLRLCHSLMQREASVVSVMEMQVRNGTTVYDPVSCSDPPSKSRNARRNRCRSHKQQA